MAIVGTAQSWKLTPWADPGVELWSLNDAYRLPGFQRADRWFDLHPFDAMWFVPKDTKSVHASQIPPGKHYLRPHDYLDWLAKQQIPVYLQTDPPAGFGLQAQRYPKEAIEQAFGRYFTSTPAWMLALAVAEGFQEIAIYGIHLATEHEYIEQRPNFEYLIGRVLGRGKVTTTVKDGMRHYETQDGHVLLPADSPVLQSDFQYAYETRPRACLLPLQVALHEETQKRDALVKTITQAPWYRPMRHARTALPYADARVIDAQQSIARAQYALQR